MGIMDWGERVVPSGVFRRHKVKKRSLAGTPFLVSM